MLSSLVSRGAVWRPISALRFTSTNAVNGSAATTVTSSTPSHQEVDIFENEKNPLRDHVNFPRRVRPIYPGPVRHGFIPEEWFSFFHEKTGVTGPYIFGAGVTTYIISKEIWVLEHDFYCGLALLAALTVVVKKVGPSYNAFITKAVDNEEAQLKSIRQNEIDRCKDAIKEEETAQWMATSYEALIEAKKETVALQLEANYRSRLQEAYQQVKRRLDYQLETANVLRRTEQKHMVNWIIANVRKNITPKQEEDAMRKCIGDLKKLASA